MKIFVAIPVYDGKLQIQTVKCLLEEQCLAALSGDELYYSFLPSCSVPAMGRNQLVGDFLKTDCDKIFFLDSDVTFELGSLLKIAKKPVGIVGGCYRFKLDQECYPVDWLGGDLQWDENELLEVETLPTGFMAISRKVFEELTEAYPERNYTHHGRTECCFFEMRFENGVLHSDDTYFCKLWRSIGGKVFLDPEVSLVHWGMGSKPYPGHIGNWLKQQNGIPLETELKNVS